MAKKVKDVSKEYLEKKLKDLFEKRDNVEKIIDDYMTLYQKLNGAIEVTQGILSDTGSEEGTEPNIEDK